MVEVKRGLFTFSGVRARPSAKIRVVEVKKLRTFYEFCKPRATLCGDCACRSALAEAPCDFLARETAFGSCIPPWSAADPARKSQLLSTKVARRACLRSSGWKIATFKYRRSMRSVLPQLRLENLSTNVVRGAHSCISGWKIATFTYKNSTRSTFPQLRQYLRRATCAESLARATCAEQLAQSTCTKHLRRATCTDQLAHAQSACTEQLAQSTCAEQLAQSTCAEQLAQITCVQQLAESNLRAAAWNNAACADHFLEKSRGAVRAKHIAPSRLVQSQLAQSQLRRATREK